MEVAGWVGFAMTQIFYLPQIIKIFRNHNVSSLALPSWFILATALLSSLIYSVSIHNNVFIAGNAAGLTQSLFMIGLIFRFRKVEVIEAKVN